MAGQDFADIHVANERLRRWVREHAGARIHGTTHQPPLRVFHEQEQAALQPLPPEPFTLCEVRPVKVHPDCHVVIESSYYSVPWRYVGQTLDAYIGERVVQLFQGTELIVTHDRQSERGRWSTGCFRHVRLHIPYSITHCSIHKTARQR